MKRRSVLSSIFPVTIIHSKSARCGKQVVSISHFINCEPKTKQLCDSRPRLQVTEKESSK